MDGKNTHQPTEVRRRAAVGICRLHHAHLRLLEAGQLPQEFLQVASGQRGNLVAIEQQEFPVYADMMSSINTIKMFQRNVPAPVV